MFTIIDNDNGATLHGKSLHSVWQLHTNMPADNLKQRLTALMADPAHDDIHDNGLSIVRTPSGFSIRNASGTFDLPWQHVHALVAA